MTFYGKYTFQSTNPTGAKKFLTTSSNQGQTYPTPTAHEASEIERWIVYQENDDSLTIQILDILGHLYYLSVIESVGWVIGSLSSEDAYPMKFIDKGNSEFAFEIFTADTNQWLPIRYSVNVTLAYLIFPIPGSEVQLTDDTFYNFTRLTITPSLSEIQTSKNARGFDFQYVDLSQADLSGVDCSGADFTNAILDGANFSGATLSKAIFVGASLDNTNLSETILDGAIFTGTNLSTVDWGSSNKIVNAISAKGTQFDDCTGVGCQIATKNNSKKHADFTGANFKGADFSYSDFSYAYFKEASLISGVFVGAIFEQADFTSAQLGGLDKTAAANLAYAYMPNVIFNKTNLFGVSFAFATVFGASTKMSDTATMEETDFSNAYLEGIDLTSATLRGVKFNNACLVNVNLTTADLSPTASGSIISSLNGACIQGAAFTESTLSNADLTNATVAFSKGSVNVRYCNPLVDGPFPPPPQFEQLNYSTTKGLDLTTMTAGTVCPNGSTVAANQKLENNLTEMLTIADPATEWIPIRCSLTESSEPLPEKGTSRPCDLSIVIETPHIVLKKFSLRHFRDLRRLADDPDTKRYLFNNENLSDQRIKAMIHFYQTQQKRNGITSWPAYRKTDKAFIGICGLTKNDQAGSADIQVAVVPEFRGDPLVKEMYQAVLDYGFYRLLLDRILTKVAQDNIAAEKFVSKIGFRFLHKTLILKMYPYNVYEITREDL